MPATPSFSIVINTDGRRDALEKTLQSLSYIDYPSYEVVVVCGPTLDGTVELVEQYRGAIKIGLCPERNLSMSRNIGIAMSAGDMVAFIDDDAFPEAEWLRDLAAGYESAVVGGTGGRVYDHTGWHFQYGYAMADRLGNSWGHLDAPVHEYNFRLSDKYPYIQGTNASFRRSALIEIGGFDEEFAYYLDETDVCCRMVDNGYHLRQLPGAFVHHKFLPSNIRNANRVVKDKFQIVKNKIYFSLVNNQRHHSSDEIIQDNRKFVDQHCKELEMHADAGRASWDDVTRFWEDVDRAWVIGLGRALSGERRLLRPSRAATLYEEFLPFPSIVPEGGRKVFCFVSGEYAPTRIGGIGTYTEAAARGLADLGHHVHVLTHNPENNTIDFENGVWVHRLQGRQIHPVSKIELGVPARIWNFSGTMRGELFRIHARRQITCVEAPIWDVEGVAIVDEGIFPCVTSLHTTLKIWLETHRDRVADEDFMAKFGYPMLALEKYMLRSSDGIHANSQSIVETICAYSGVEAGKDHLKVIHHGVRDPGIDKRKIAPKRRSSRPVDALFGSSDPVNILFVGRLERRKGVDILFEALDGLLANHPDVSCDIVGDDKVPWDGKTSFLQVYAERLAPHVQSGRLRIHGRAPADRLDQLYRDCDILAAPSRYESFGLTVIEGFAYGKVVVGARTGGIAEIIDSDRTGILFESENAAELQSILQRLLVSPDERARLSRAAREEFDARFSWRRMASDMAEFFERFERRIVPTAAMTFSQGVRQGVSLREKETGVMLPPRSWLEFDHDGATLFLHFWRHEWSGFVRVWCGGSVVEEWNLYSEAPKFGAFVAADLPAGVVRIEASGRRDDRAKGSEVIFYRAAAAATERQDISEGLYSRRALARAGRSKNNDSFLVRMSDMRFSDPHVRLMDLWQKETGVLVRVGRWIEFDALTPTLQLELWRHAWSGIMELAIDGVHVSEWDLYAATAGLFTVTCDLPARGRIRLSASGRKSQQSHGAEVILYRAKFLPSQKIDAGIAVASYFRADAKPSTDREGAAPAGDQQGHLEVTA